MKNINFSLFFKANLFLTIIIFLLFLQYNDDYSFESLILSIFSAISSAIILYLLLYILLFIFKFTNRFILYFSSLIFIAVNISLVVDYFIYRLYKFHINAMVINIITSPDAADSIDIGILPFLVFLFIVIFFVLFEFYLIKKLLFTNEEIKEKLNKKLNKTIVIPLIVIVLFEKVSYGMYSLFNKNDVITKIKVIPLYQPLTFSRMASKYFDFKPEVQKKNTINTKATLIYPKNEMIIKDNPNKFNIFIIASDSVKQSIINKEVAPNIEEFKKDSYSFENHHSGGNATRFGIFSLIYGINSTYWFSFLNENRGAVVFDVLKKLDYKIDIISSTNTNWPEFRKTAYVNIQDSIKDKFEGKPWEKDKKSTNYFLERIENHDKIKPLFSFVFLDSPHGYSFPKEFNKFKADGEGVNYLTVKKDQKSIEGLKAKYKNSIYYNDYLFKKMMDKLKEKNMYDNSLIIYTSDHGEEFYEYGFFGHNSSFSKGQSNVPFIVKLPKNLKNNITIPINYSKLLSSHNDVVPSILSMIGVKNDTKDYSNGKNIFSKDFKRDFVFNANWNNNAIITNKYTYVFSNLPNKMFNNEVRYTENYQKVKDKKINSGLLLDVINENRYFLK